MVSFVNDPRDDCYTICDAWYTDESWIIESSYDFDLSNCWTDYVETSGQCDLDFPYNEVKKSKRVLDSWSSFISCNKSAEERLNENYKPLSLDYDAMFTECIEHND